MGGDGQQGEVHQGANERGELMGRKNSCPCQSCESDSTCFLEDQSTCPVAEYGWEVTRLMLTMMAAQIRKNRLQVFDRPDAYKHMKDVKTAEEIVEEFRKKAEDERA